MREETEHIIKVMAEGYADAMMRKNHRLIWTGYLASAQKLLTEWYKNKNMNLIEKFKEELFGDKGS